MIANGVLLCISNLRIPFFRVRNVNIILVTGADPGLGQGRGPECFWLIFGYTPHSGAMRMK